MGYFSEKDIERYLYGKDEYRDREIFGCVLNETALQNENTLQNENNLTSQKETKLKEEVENGY